MFLSDLPVFREISAGLTHEPYRGCVYGLAPAGSEKSVIQFPASP